MDKSMKLAIIGTAGRGDDQRKLTLPHWRMIEIVGQTVATTLKADELISGGAAWADHVAVSLFLKGFVPKLTLYLPAAINDFQSDFVSGRTQDAGSVASYYHSVFSEIRRKNSFEDFSLARQKGAIFHVNPAGFKARNSQVAQSVDALLAFTFSGKQVPKDGGTADTVRKFLDRRVLEKDKKLSAFHFDLEEKILYSI